VLSPPQRADGGPGLAPPGARGERIVLLVKFYGVRGSCPCSDPAVVRYGGATACVGVFVDGPREPPLVLDLGTGARALGEELLSRHLPHVGLPRGAGGGGGARSAGRQAPPALRLHALVSHLHLDHVQGLPFFAPALVEGVELHLYGPATVESGETLEGALRGFLRRPYFPVALDELPARLVLHGLGEEDLRVGRADVRSRLVPHTGTTLGYRVEAGGVAVAYLSDHQAPLDSARSHVGTTTDAREPSVTGRRAAGGQVGLSRGVAELCEGVDLLVHDAQYFAEEFSVRGHWGHSTVDYALEVARAAGARRLALFHHDPSHDDELLDDLAARTAALAEAAGVEDCFVARAGSTVEVVGGAAGGRVPGRSRRGESGA
jgi:phosphoribosyl 1,2-cyclic phosphodiesterase